jgi:hypothetical protein
MKLFALLFIAAMLLTNIPESFAAFPIKKQNEILRTAIERSGGINTMQAYPPTYYNNINDDGSTGLLAFGLGMGGLVSYVLGAILWDGTAASSTVISVFAIGFVLAILAIIFGAKGHDRRNQGFAIAGCILGIIEASIPIIALLLGLLFAAIFGAF